MLQSARTNRRGKIIGRRGFPFQRVSYCRHNKTVPVIIPLIQGNLLKSAKNDTPMELKQKSKRKKGAKGSRSKAEGDLSDHLADIEVKLDHIIERIKDSLYQRNIRDHGEDEQ
jgi:hypothetical protein